MTSDQDSVTALAGPELGRQFGDAVGERVGEALEVGGRSKPISASIANVSSRCPRAAAARRAPPHVANHPRAAGEQRVGREPVLLLGHRADERRLDQDRVDVARTTRSVQPRRARCSTSSTSPSRSSARTW